jgi:glucose/arabinose dehydrogenase
MFRFFIALFLFISCSHAAEHTKEVSADSTAAKKDTAKSPSPVVPNDGAVMFNYSTDKVTYKNVPVRLAKGDSFVLKIPQGFDISIAAEGLKRLRFLALSPDGRLFATDMFDKSDNKKGKVLIFQDWNGETKKFGRVVTYLDSLHNPNQLAFHGNYIYVAETDKLSRYDYHAGDDRATGTPQVIATFPDYGLSYKYGGWHLTRSIAFHNDKLYISVGSSCNACLEKETIRASLLEMNPDGSEMNVFARGLRNSVGIKWIGDQLWSTGMGRDLIGPDKPEDVFQQVSRDGFYGWPFYFQYRNTVYEDPAFKDSARAAWVVKPPVAFCGFRAHSAPLGFEYFKGFADTLLGNSVLVCLHGSTSVWRERGNAIVKVGKGNNYTEIVSGFLTGKTEAGRHGRPCDIVMKDTRSFFFTDDHNGVLYYVWK